MPDKHFSINLNIRGINQSPTILINDLSKSLENSGRTIYRMGLGQSPFPVPATVVDTLKLHAHEKDYLPAKGLPALREAVAKFHAMKDNVDIRPENVLIGPGSKELMFILQLVFYGDIILPTPCWVSYAPQSKIIGRNIKYLNTTFENHWKITAEQLESFFISENDRYKPRLLVLNYPGNPDGGTYSSEELIAITKVAAEYELIILSDEIYGQLHHEGKHISIAQFYPHRTIISSGLSKWCGAGGWRLGTFAFPQSFTWLMEPMASVASETYTSVSAPIQYAAVRAFNGDILIERYLWHVRRILSYIGNRSAQILLNAGLKVHPPLGAFYLFVDFSNYSETLWKNGIKTSAELCNKLLEDTGVAVLPGVAFQRPPDEFTFRLAYVNFDGAKCLAYSETIPISEHLPEDFSRNFCNSVFQGVNNIAEWALGLGK